jgi:hypothetical protein
MSTKKPPLKAISESNDFETEPKETKEQLFHRLMDRHLYGPSGLKNRYRLMRKTINARKITKNEADLIQIAVQSEFEKFAQILKSRVEEDQEGGGSIWR